MFHKTIQALSFFTLLWLLFLLAAPITSSAQGNKDAWLKKMAPLMKPTPFTKSSLGAVQGQMIKVISVIGKSDRTQGPKPNELITRACKTHRSHGPIRTMITANVVEQAYEEALYLGLFDKKGNFKNVIQKGPYAGEKVKFEYIVPAEKAPEFSQDIANLRLVRVGQKQQNNSFADREKIHLLKLQKIKQETRSRQVLHESESGHLLDTTISTPDKGPHYEKWEASMEVAGEEKNELPRIKLVARKRSSASRNNGEKLAIWVKVENLTKAPTMVTAHCFMLGRTERKRVLFNIGHGKKEVVLLAGDTQQMLLYSRSFPSMKNHVADLDGLKKKERSKAKFFVRGWVVRVEHNGKVVATGASMPSLLPYADENYRGLNGLP